MGEHANVGVKAIKTIVELPFKQSLVIILSFYSSLSETQVFIKVIFCELNIISVSYNVIVTTDTLKEIGSKPLIGFGIREYR